ncbi:MAG: threonine/serine exporter family protein [Clostridia bacterium]|nr:threonine/serine exporter family protein [Clostridia bacterium]
MENQPKHVNKNNYAEYLLCLALDVGEGMLKNGAEISRVEDTIERICRAYGAIHVEVFSIISFISAAIRLPDGSYSSQQRRVRSTSTNLNTLERLNSLSREICKETPELDIFDEKIHEIKKTSHYPIWVKVIASAFAVGGFAIFFGGELIDGIVAALIGITISVVENYSPKRINSMAKTVVSSFFASLIAGLSVMLGLGTNADAVIIGTIMILVPGLAFGTALRDLLCGDLLAGSLKTLNACLGALMIAFGYMLAASLLGGAI